MNAQLSPRERRVLRVLAIQGGKPIRGEELASIAAIKRQTLHVVISQLRWRFGADTIDTYQGHNYVHSYALSSGACGVLAAIDATDASPALHSIATQPIGKASTEGAEGYAHR